MRETRKKSTHIAWFPTCTRALANAPETEPLNANASPLVAPDLALGEGLPDAEALVSERSSWTFAIIKLAALDLLRSKTFERTGNNAN